MAHAVNDKEEKMDAYANKTISPVHAFMHDLHISAVHKSYNQLFILW